MTKEGLKDIRGVECDSDIVSNKNYSVEIS